MKIAVISGGFDPIHSGHISYIKSALKFGERLIVLLNSDGWLKRKKGKAFMNFRERKTILESIKNIDLVLDFEDDEHGSCINGLLKILDLYPEDEIIFCNGGDRNQENIPEMSVDGISFEFGVGGNEKENSSSSILKDWNYPSEQRIWGIFYNLYQDSGIKVKELVVNPKSGMSFQKHFKRNELWVVTSGSCIVNLSDEDPANSREIALDRFDRLHIQLGHWHQITNPFDEVCKIIEIQYGQETNEDDIERLSYYDDKSL